MRWFVLLLVCFSSALWARVEGAAQRYGFEPGDKVFYATTLAECPVGEFVKGIRAVQGSYECARYQDRIWLRPLKQDTVLLIPFSKPLEGDFALEFDYVAMKPGCPFAEFRLHDIEGVKRFGHHPYAYVGGALLGGRVNCSAQPVAFGAVEQPGRVPFEFKLRTRGDGRPHHVAIQVRRGQVRFFVDGRRVAHKPFSPTQPLSALSWHFSRMFGASTPYADAPVLVGDIRITRYSRAEAAPQAEKDLIRALHATQTDEGLKVVLDEAILFDFGKWALKPEARRTLDQLAKLARYRKGIIRVRGYTDNVGSEQFNRVLSELRAHVVALALARRGVDPARLQPKGYGARHPVASNDTAAGRARNRRVEVIFQ